MTTTTADTRMLRTIPPPTTSVKVADQDELDVWVVGEGTPVVFVHGALLYSIFKPTAQELAKKGNYQAIWYHRRGYNAKPTEPADVVTQSQDIVKILDALDIRKAHVVGHSAGAAFVLALALQAEDRLLSAALLDFVLIGQVESSGFFLEAVAPSLQKAQAGDLEGAAKEFLDVVGCTKELVDRTLPGSWSAMANDAPTWFQRDTPALNAWTPDSGKMAAIDGPVAFLPTSQVPPLRETGELLRSWLPRLKMLELSVDNHFFPLSATAETAALVDSWIRSQ